MTTIQPTITEANAFAPPICSKTLLRQVVQNERRSFFSGKIDKNWCRFKRWQCVQLVEQVSRVILLKACLLQGKRRINVRDASRFMMLVHTAVFFRFFADIRISCLLSAPVISGSLKPRYFLIDQKTLRLKGGLLVALISTCFYGRVENFVIGIFLPQNLMFKTRIMHERFYMGYYNDLCYNQNNTIYVHIHN